MSGITAPTTLEEQIDVLDIFIESVHELTNSWFVQQVKSDGIAATFKWAHSGLVAIDRNGPELEAVKSVLLTIRFFCQSRTERASIENVDKIIAALTVDQSLKDRFQQSRVNLNSYLQSPPSVTFPPEGGAGTRQMIFDTLLYGRFAHADPKKRKIARRWESECYYSNIRTQFDLIVLKFIIATDAMGRICEEVRAKVSM